MNADKHELQVTRLALDTALNIQKDLQQEVERLRNWLIMWVQTEITDMELMRLVEKELLQTKEEKA